MFKRIITLTIKELSYQKKKLEDTLRKNGVEGEDAFYVLAYQYLLRFSDTIKEQPQGIVEKGRRAFSRIENDGKTIASLESIISGDPKGENLPVWYQHFLGRRFREGSGKFFTPHTIAQAMTNLIPRKRNAVIMDPTCGGGTFLIEASKKWGKLPCQLVANDIEVSLVDLAQIILYLQGSKSHKKSFIKSNIFEPNLQFQELYGQIDYILANPPFSLQIDSIETESKLYSLGYRNSDALFLDICLQLLKPQGRLVCLLPHSIVANREFEKLRSALEETWTLLGVIGMPEGVFHLTASTTTRADIIILEKKWLTCQRSPKVIFAYAPSVGIPLNSRMREQEVNYLSEIVNSPDLAYIRGSLL